MKFKKLTLYFAIILLTVIASPMLSKAASSDYSFDIAWETLGSKHNMKNTIASTTVKAQTYSYGSVTSPATFRGTLTRFSKSYSTSNLQANNRTLISKFGQVPSGEHTFKVRKITGDTTSYHRIKGNGTLFW